MYIIYNSFDLATFRYIEYLNQVSLVISYFFMQTQKPLLLNSTLLPRVFSANSHCVFSCQSSKIRNITKLKSARKYHKIYFFVKIIESIKSK